MNRFQTAAITLIAFNVVGTLLTWTAQLQQPGTSTLHAMAQGTEFTGPTVFVALWCLTVAMSFRPKRVGSAGIILTTVFALLFTIGESTELAKSNVGITDAKWDVVMTATVVGVILGVGTVATGVHAAVSRRRRQAAGAELTAAYH